MDRGNAAPVEPLVVGVMSFTPSLVRHPASRSLQHRAGLADRFDGTGADGVMKRRSHHSRPAGVAPRAQRRTHQAPTRAHHRGMRSLDVRLPATRRP